MSDRHWKGSGDPPAMRGLDAAYESPVRQAGARDTLRWVILGREDAGKTSLAGALCQSCARPPTRGDPFEVSILGAHEETTAALMSQAYRRVCGHPATVDNVDYRFLIDVTRRGEHRRIEISTEVNLLDGPGGATVPASTPSENVVPANSEAAAMAWAFAAMAQGLLICVDANVPDPSALSFGVQKLCAHLRAARKRERTASIAAPDTPVRVLVLLNKVDTWLPMTQSAAGTAHDVARRLDSIPLARRILGDTALYPLHATVREFGQVAVGFSSALGFDRDGSPWETSLDGTRPLDFRDWRPFGVQELLVYLLTGQTSGTIQALNDRSFSGNPRL